MVRRQKKFYVTVVYTYPQKFPLISNKRSRQTWTKLFRIRADVSLVNGFRISFSVNKSVSTMGALNYYHACFQGWDFSVYTTPGMLLKIQSSLHLVFPVGFFEIKFKYHTIHPFIIQWILVYSRICATSSQPIIEHFYHFKRNLFDLNESFNS